MSWKEWSRLCLCPTCNSIHIVGHSDSQQLFMKDSSTRSLRECERIKPRRVGTVYLLANSSSFTFHYRLRPFFNKHPLVVGAEQWVGKWCTKKGRQLYVFVFKCSCWAPCTGSELSLSFLCTHLSEFPAWHLSIALPSFPNFSRPFLLLSVHLRYFWTVSPLISIF